MGFVSIGMSIAIAAASVFLLMDVHPIFDSAFRYASYPLDESIGVVDKISYAELYGKVTRQRALVVGGTAGIGLGISKTLAAHGASVSIVGRRYVDLSLLDRYAEEVHKEAAVDSVPVPATGLHSLYQYDLSTIGGCMALVRALGEKSKEQWRFDAVYFTVGVWPSTSNEYAFTSDGVEKVVAVDLLARHTILHGLYKAGLLSSSAVIVNSLASTTPMPAQTTDQVLDRVKNWNKNSLDMGAIAIAADAWLQGASRSIGGSMRFVGFHPGIVVTDLPASTLPAWALPLFRIAAAPIAISAEASGLAHITVANSATLAKAEMPKVSYFNYLREARMTHPQAYNSTFGDEVWQLIEDITLQVLSR